MEELIDVLDENGIKTGEVKTKLEIKRDGNYHRAISICIINEKLEILLQKRSSNKKVYPNLWSLFVKGHVQAHEDSKTACIREIKQELGISIKEDELTYLYTIKEEKTNKDYIENIFYDTYLVIKNVDLSDVKTEKQEVSEVKYMYYQDVFKLLSEINDTFVPNLEDYKRLSKILKSSFEKNSKNLESQ